MDAPYSPATLEGLTNAELRAIAARAGAITARRASKTPYPSRVPPSLILQFLPLDSVARALRVSATWRGQAEPTFRGIAERSGQAVAGARRLLELGEAALQLSPVLGGRAGAHAR